MVFCSFSVCFFFLFSQLLQIWKYKNLLKPLKLICAIIIFNHSALTENFNCSNKCQQIAASTTVILYSIPNKLVCHITVFFCFVLFYFNNHKSSLASFFPLSEKNNYYFHYAHTITRFNWETMFKILDDIF